jgi:hypothetical protein
VGRRLSVISLIWELASDELEGRGFVSGVMSRTDRRTDWPGYRARRDCGHRAPRCCTDELLHGERLFAVHRARKFMVRPRGGLIWPHEARFPYRGRLFRWGCVLCALGPFCFPGLTFHERLLTLVAAFVGLASTYLDFGVLLCLMRWSSLLHRFLAFVLYYGVLGSLAEWLAEVGIAIARGAPLRGFASASTIAFGLSSSLGMAAAAFNAIHWKPRGLS